jgi:hypothetical protein
MFRCRCIAPRGAGLQLCSAQKRFMSVPNWKYSISTRRDRSKEKKEAERKARQMEKLPPVEVLSTFPYAGGEGDKMVLTDYMFQPTVYTDELDTPYLWDLGQTSDFVLNWNIHDFAKTQYPPVPAVDHRLHAPGSIAFEDHAIKALKYLQKHDVAPTFVPYGKNQVNLSVVFGDDDQNAAPKLTRENFWMTAHCGNFIELAQLQKCPSVFVVDENTFSADPSTKASDYYTLVVASPDYPFRTRPGRGFYLNWIVSNLTPSKVKDGELRPTEGVSVVPYTPPLPSEDAGTARTLCMLFRQKDGKAIPNLRPPTKDELADKLPFSVRSNFRLHAGLPTYPSLQAVEASLVASSGHPIATTFTQTVWDIQVQEFYESIGVLEPNYVPEDLDSILQFNARPSEAERIKGKWLEDGTRVNDRHYLQFHTVRDNTLLRTNFSKRTLLSKDGKYIKRPNEKFFT